MKAKVKSFRMTLLALVCVFNCLSAYRLGHFAINRKAIFQGESRISSPVSFSSSSSSSKLYGSRGRSNKKQSGQGFSPISKTDNNNAAAIDDNNNTPQQPPNSSNGQPKIDPPQDIPTMNPYSNGPPEIVSVWDRQDPIANPEFITQPPNILTELSKGADQYRILVPRENPFLASDMVPREVLLFGDVRIPPPANIISIPAYHWARHSHTLPINSEERVNSIFPKTFDHPQASELRIPKIDDSTSYEDIKQAFIKALDRTNNPHDRLANAVDFITCNLDHLSPHLLLLAMTQEKMSLQSKKRDFSAIESLRRILNMAAQRLAFSFYLEQQVAESRVLTYRGLMGGIESIAQLWDGAEVTLFFNALINGRLTYDGRIQEITRKIDYELAYINDDDILANARDAFIRRRLAKPTLTAEVYLNASRVIAELVPSVYERVAPEIRALHEAYFMLPKADYHEQKELLELYYDGEIDDESEDILVGGQDVYTEAELVMLQEEDRKVKEYFDTVFIQQSGITTARLVQRLQTMEHLMYCEPELCAIYAPLTNMLRRLRQALTSYEEREAQELWFDKYIDQNPYETYEADPMAATEEQARISENTGTLPQWLFWQTILQDSKNEFIQGFKRAFDSVIYLSRSFNGSRRKASDPNSTGDWLKDDPVHDKNGFFDASSRQEESNEKLRAFAKDYVARVEYAIKEVRDGTKMKDRNIHPKVALNARLLQNFLIEEQAREDGLLKGKVENVIVEEEDKLEEEELFVA